MVVCLLFPYTLIGWSPVESIVSSTAGYAHSPLAPRFAVIPMIHCTARWWYTIRNLSISPVTTELSLPYSNTNFSPALYISPRDRTVAPIISRTLDIIPHRLQNLRRFRYTDAQYLLLYATVRPKYGNASNGGKVSELIWNNILRAPKQCCRVSRLRCLYSPCLHFSDV